MFICKNFVILYEKNITFIINIFTLIFIIAKIIKF